MSDDIAHISICVCTYRRLGPLKRLLTALSEQDTKGLFSFSIIICDNDGEQSARKMVSDFVAGSLLDITYCFEPRKSIALARNKSLQHAKGDAIAFIDDDEFPCPDWLFCLLKALNDYKAAGVFGPVRPHFDAEPPSWVIKSGLCERPEHQTGFVVPWMEARTGNAFLRRALIEEVEIAFKPELELSGSDTDLFRRLMAAGHTFIWCNEAVVYEVVAPSHWKRRFFINRALLRGKNSLLFAERRWISVSKSLIAVSAYSIALPFLQLMGHHLFMNYLVRLCDHLGKLLALAGFNPIRERHM